jgi:hypothetical protein
MAAAWRPGPQRRYLWDDLLEHGRINRNATAFDTSPGDSIFANAAPTQVDAGKI